MSVSAKRIFFQFHACIKTSLNCDLQSSFFSIIPNCIMKAKSEKRRPFIGDQIDECRDASGLFYILGFQKVTFLFVFWYIFLSRFLYIYSDLRHTGLLSELGSPKNSLGLCIQRTVL